MYETHPVAKHRHTLILLPLLTHQINPDHIELPEPTLGVPKHKAHGHLILIPPLHLVETQPLYLVSHHAFVLALFPLLPPYLQYAIERRPIVKQQCIVSYLRWCELLGMKKLMLLLYILVVEFFILSDSFVDLHHQLEMVLVRNSCNVLVN